jgi:hypothetical protein
VQGEAGPVGDVRKAEAEAGVKPAPSSGGEVTEAFALQEASVDAINRAMYHDIYNVSSYQTITSHRTMQLAVN